MCILLEQHFYENICLKKFSNADKKGFKLILPLGFLNFYVFRFI